MIIPVCCFTCGKVVGNKWEKYQKRQSEDIPNDKIFEELGLKRYCCKRMLLGHVDLVDKMLEYSEEK